MISLFSSASPFKARIERLVRFPSAATLPAPVAAACVLAIALFGLTDAVSATDAAIDDM